MSEDDTVMVCSGWDSGPFPTYNATNEKESRISKYGRIIAPVPREVWERYEEACEQKDVAELALDDAVAESVLALETNPRWKEKA